MFGKFLSFKMKLVLSDSFSRILLDFILHSSILISFKANIPRTYSTIPFNRITKASVKSVAGEDEIIFTILFNFKKTKFLFVSRRIG